MICRRLLVSAPLLVAVACGGAAPRGLVLSPDVPDPVAESLRRMPASSPARENELAAALRQVPGAVGTLVGMLGATTASDDAAARYGLEALVRWSTRPSERADRQWLAGELGAALSDDRPVETRRFVIEQLERLGRPDSVPVLVQYLQDEALGDAVARALSVIGGEAAAQAVLEALRDSQPEWRADLMVAAGRLGIAQAAPLLERALQVQDRHLQRAAAVSLAELARPESASPLLAALRGAEGLQRHELGAAMIRYGEHLETGREGSGVAVLEQVLQLGRDSQDESLQIAALRALEETSPDATARALETTPPGSSPRLAAVLAQIQADLDVAQQIRQRAEQEAREGFVPLFNGTDLEGWVGATDGYFVQDGAIVCDPHTGGNLYTAKEYSDFVLRFEFKLTPGANNGLGIRAPLQGDAAYAGMELQILDDTARSNARLHPYQYHGSIYGVVAAERGHLLPVGQWNEQEVLADGSHIRVVLNGATILDVDLDRIDRPADGRRHPGLHNTRGHIGFLGHGARVQFRNIRLRDLGAS